MIWGITGPKVVCLSIQIADVQAFETCMGLVILANVLLIVHETNQDALCHPQFAENMNDCPQASSKIVWAWACNLALQVVYSLECVVRFYVERGNYVKSRWNMIDLLIVLILRTSLIF